LLGFTYETMQSVVSEKQRSSFEIAVHSEEREKLRMSRQSLRLTDSRPPFLSAASC
jgi:hypothetical protein